MSTNKTQVTDLSFDEFLSASVDPVCHNDCRAIAAMMQKVTGEKPVMWGASLVGFGRYRYKYESGGEGEWFVVGFSPRKNDLTIYLLSGFDRFEALFAKLGKHKIGKSCVYVKTLADIDLKVLTQLIKDSVAAMEAERVR
ncbi:MAG: DUF1801 domain-containing protein [Casimicrobium sp.]